MLIENYKGIEIKHDAQHDEFFTDIEVGKTFKGKKQYIRNKGLQKTRDDIDKYLATASKKPVLQKVWIRNKEGYSSKEYDYTEATLISYNAISGEVRVTNEGGKGYKDISLNGRGYSSDQKLFIQCNENNAIVKAAKKVNAEIEKHEKSISCLTGKMIPLTVEHFK